MESLVRYRAWIVMAVVFLAVVLAVTLGAGTKSGAGRGGRGIPQVSFGSQVKELGASGLLIYTNGWVATSGAQSIGVSAGSERSDRRNGLFVIQRRIAGRRRLASVVVRGSGAVTLLRPGMPQSEPAAFTETLHFVTANGATGVLKLSGDRLSVSD